jgi:hypothetical protein
VTTTLSASESISALVESAAVVLLRLILSPKLIPVSVDALNITSLLLFAVLLVHHDAYRLALKDYKFITREIKEDTTTVVAKPKPYHRYAQHNY